MPGGCGGRKARRVPQIDNSTSSICEESPTSVLTAATVAQMASAWNPSVAQATALRRVANALHDGSTTVNVVTLGGSMVAGAGMRADCHSLKGGEEPRCSFANVFATWLAQCAARTPALVHHENRAHPGMTTAGSMPSLTGLLGGDAPIDLLLVDYSVNDAHESATSTAAATEALLLHLGLRHPQTAVLLVDAYCEPGSASNVSVAKQRVARAYGVPFLSFRRAIAVSCQHAWQGETSNHPAGQTHRDIALMIRHWWKAMTARPLSEGLSNFVVPPSRPLHADSAAFGGCTPKSIFDPRAPDANAGAVRVTTGEWRAYADRANKPGWITTGPTGSTIEFDLAFGATPRLFLVYERGYEGFGEAAVWLKGALRNRNFIQKCREKQSIRCMVLGPPYHALDGIRSDGSRVTQSALQVYQYGIQPNANDTLVVRTTSSRKFKLRYVASC